MATKPPPAKNAMTPPSSNRKSVFITRIHSNSLSGSASHHHDENGYFSATGSPELNLDSAPITYTSLKDLMPSRSGLAFRSVHEIAVRTNLVRNASWAYSQPMPKRVRTCLGKQFFNRVWDELKPPVDACVKFITNKVILKITRAFGRVVGAIRFTAFV